MHALICKSFQKTLWNRQGTQVRYHSFQIINQLIVHLLLRRSEMRLNAFQQSVKAEPLYFEIAVLFELLHPAEQRTGSIKDERMGR